MSDIPRSPNVFHPRKPSAVGSRNSLAQEGRAQKAAIKETMNMIKNLNILGVVYNSATGGNIDSHYPKYYRSGYKYRKKGK